ncbi:MAG TPA: DDE-type integrase/transposase/recombinase [Xanthobacteraceae bacterium]|nr:DDE-type integrase/transposase/recombinase [Xanthobacteraceae bacterium]
MREDNLLCLRRPTFRPATTDSDHAWRIWPNLARKVVPMAVNRLWVADITYVRLAEEFVYLAVILDGFSRKVIGWALEDHLQAGLAIEALEMALAGRDVRRGELIHHSDRGVQGGFKRSSQQSRCWLIEVTGQAPLQAFSNQASFGAGS